jgi:VWFA-related protein
VRRASIALLCLAATMPLNGQNTPTFRSGANYVRVDMYATRDGQPIEDLKPDEVEVLEDGVVQKVEAFEHVRVAPAGPQELRREPQSVRESREMAADPRARIFVIFLDTYHTRIEGSARMRLPLIRFIDRLLGPDDLVALMTPEMSAADITLGRKTTVISNIMQEQWFWGRRNRVGADDDPKEQLYKACFGEPNAGANSAGKMIDRRREKLTLDALENLISHLDGIREERKAVLTVTEGWLLFEPDKELMNMPEGQRQQPGDVLGRRPVPRPNDQYDIGGAGRVECQADRIALSLLDHSQRLRELADLANKSNVTFYPVYAMGLTPFDTDINDPSLRPPNPFTQEAIPTTRQRDDDGGALAVDRRNMSKRQDGLRYLADMTDGTSVINTNNTEAALKRITDDLSSYYLLGYYSSNTKLDGKFRDITVRIKRPGSKVRARRGYRGRTAEDVLRGTESSRTGGDTAVTSALSAVAGVNNRSQLRIRPSTWSRPEGGGAFWLVGELDFRLRKELAWTAGAVAELTVAGADGAQLMSREIKIPSNQGSFALQVPDSGSLAPGEYAVRVRLRPEGGTGESLSDLARVVVGSPAPMGEAVLWRRGLTTGPQYLRTADPRFSRSDRIRLELAATSSEPATARLLDRAGNAIQVPLQVSHRPDVSGAFSWVVVDGTLSPLAPGDFAIEVTRGSARQVTGFRIVP